MFDKLKSVFGDNRGVSPVIGVILMVAITVILAAVIGTFVLNLGGNLQSTPQAQIAVEDADDSSPAGTSGTTAVLNINHRGGDTIPEGDIRIRVQGPVDSSLTTLWDGSNDNYNYGAGDDNASIRLEAGDPPGDLSVGGTVTVEADAGDDKTDFAGEWEVTIIHTPSDSILVDTTVNVD